MSIKLINHVWEKSQHKGSALLLLLAIADYANDAGEAYPSYETLAHKSRLSVRRVMDVIRKLEASGELIVRRCASPYGTNIYVIRGEESRREISPYPVVVNNINNNINKQLVNDGLSEIQRREIAYEESRREISPPEDITDEKYKELVSVYGVERVEHVIDVYNWLSSEGKVKSIGWIYKCLSENWSDPGGYIPPEERCPECGLPWSKHNADCSAHRRKLTAGWLEEE